ncbi:hypothetical protein B296_00030317 [Ensete ventricosum]|uniref:RRM domain-containing protein n=1 Tax=Ensete ventricosum TaxID=4639 RepID=A0A426ZQP1_ENSVE|nr:hypothetical protein B296_00030317 [Ensete ventricosum]
MASSSASSSSSPSTYSPRNRSRFGDTTFTKVFVGGLAWETPTEELRRYFEQFGQILEAVIITDKITGRSKGYGFVSPPSLSLSLSLSPVRDVSGVGVGEEVGSGPQPGDPRQASQLQHCLSGEATTLSTTRYNVTSISQTLEDGYTHFVHHSCPCERKKCLLSLTAGKAKLGCHEPSIIFLSACISEPSSRPCAQGGGKTRARTGAHLVGDCHPQSSTLLLSGEYMAYPSAYGYQQVGASSSSVPFIWFQFIKIFLGVSGCLMHGYLLKQAAAYNPQMASSYYEELYGPTSPSPAVATPYRHPHMAFSQQTARASFPSPAHGRRPPYAQHPAPISTPTPPHGIQNTTAGYHHLNPLPSMFAYDEASTFLRDFDTT